MGLEKSLSIFDKIRNEVGIPVLTDVHTAEQCSVVATRRRSSNTSFSMSVKQIY